MEKQCVLSVEYMILLLLQAVCSSVEGYMIYITEILLLKLGTSNPMFLATYIGSKITKCIENSGSCRTRHNFNI